ncbi:MAG: hypothetical protein KC475_08960, partial [Cyanobacteria bacterium HKST-UBA03]|nr:hypothetical protein [Cyanobacteria bacterium HKST-UBA03]
STCRVHAHRVQAGEENPDRLTIVPRAAFEAALQAQPDLAQLLGVDPSGDGVLFAEDIAALKKK